MACKDCDGTGWVHGVRVVNRPGIEPYEAEFSRRCEKCNAVEPRRVSGPSMITGSGIKQLFGNLSLLKYFPADEEGRQAVATYIERFATTDEQLEWLGQRALEVFREWPDVVELRNCFNSRFKPRDGVTMMSLIYPDGFPSEKPERMLEPPPAAEAREDPEEMRASIRAVAEQLERNRAARKERVPDVKVELPTQADIDRVKEQQRQNQERRKLWESGDAEPTAT